MKDLTKPVKMILVPCKAEDLKPEHWLLLNPKKNVLHIPAAGGQYRRMIQYGYVPVKPYLVCSEEIKLGDKIINTLDNLIGECIDVPSKEEIESGEYLKIIATPEMIFGSQIIPFDDGIEYDLTIEEMNLILRVSNGACKIQVEYNGVVTENPDEILNEIQAGKVKPKLVDGKVIIIF